LESHIISKWFFGRRLPPAPRLRRPKKAKAKAEEEEEKRKN
jgi:hypothetical protein